MTSLARLLTLAALFMSACQPVPSPCQGSADTPRYLMIDVPQAPAVPTPGPSPTPVSMKIGGNTIQVNRIVEGPLCNDTWSGTVYVACNVQVYPWEKQPHFFKNCNLMIEPGTVVYVAYHNNTPYYNGCSCHSGLTTKP